MTQQIMMAVVLVMTMMLTACGNTSVTNYGGVSGNGYFQGGGMGNVDAAQFAIQ